MGCFFSKHKEPEDGIYLEVNELKDIEQITKQKAVHGRLKNPIPKPYTRKKALRSEASLHTSKSSSEPKLNISNLQMGRETDAQRKNEANNNHDFGDTTDTMRTTVTEMILHDTVSRKCSFGAETKIMEFNPKKSINIYRLESGSLREEDDDEDNSQCELYMGEESVICNDHFVDIDHSLDVRNLAFQNRNFLDSSLESDIADTSCKEQRSTYPKLKVKSTSHNNANPHSSVGVRRIISQRKGAAMESNQLAEASADSSHRGKQKNSCNDRLATGLKTSSVENLDDGAPVYHTRRRISAISISSIDRDSLNALDGIHHLHPHGHHQASQAHPERRNSAFDSNVRRLSINLAHLFHNQSS